MPFLADHHPNIICPGAVLDSIPLYESVTVCDAILLLMDTWAVSSLELYVNKAHLGPVLPIWIAGLEATL